LRTFDLLWRNRATAEPLEIGLQFDGQADLLVLEFRFQASGLVNVRPKADVDAQRLGAIAELDTVFIPAIGGLVREEPMLADRVAIQARLAQARAGEVLRNLVVLVHQRQPEWAQLNATLARMFGFELVAPVRGAEIICEYRVAGSTGPAFDLASSGSGMLQVLLVLSLLLTHERAVLLIDEPDAHLHLILQRAIYNELRSVAALRGSQLLIATHSEQVIDTVDPRELCLMYGTPRLVADSDEKATLIQSLGALTHGDLLAVNGARGVLYVEDYTDADILRAFARACDDDDDALRLLDAELVCKRAKAEAPQGLGAVKPREHWDMLKLVNPDLPALELLDGDSPNQAPERITGTSEQLQRLRCQRCEIENYLIHPAPLRRFMEHQLGTGRPEVESALQELERTLGAGFDPMATEHPPLLASYLQREAASKGLLPAVFQAAGLNQFPKNRYFEIAHYYQTEEVHAEVRDKLAQLKAAFGRGPGQVAQTAGGDDA
jgi:hypothetical protein